jgi:NADH-quinone oxidoreductase subunit L
MLLVMLLPLMGALVSGLFTRIISGRVAQLITTGSMLVAFISAIQVFLEVTASGKVIENEILPWINISNFNVAWGWYVDSLTAVMLVVVTSVSFLVHLYSIGYMSHDESKQRFMSYLSLFTFCMLMLVTANNLLQLFFGWEGVGLCSYLLVGFWYKKESANQAAMKAFIVNRVGDCALIIGLALILYTFNSLEFKHILPNVDSHLKHTIGVLGVNLPVLEVICVLLFIGSMGKSAQLGLHTWLPDAMEGPTPVSALIHAATMVTAGIFLVARCSPLFQHTVFALNMVTIVGGITCLFAASIAVVQNDIKKVIAYSTCSQLGYMFFACGVSAYNAGIFHLMTHAFFKALLFLGAGSVIHAMSDEQDIRKMGGIWRKIPFTYTMFWIGSLAIAGIYPFAGYFSKDAILEAAYAAGSDVGKFAYCLGIMAAFCTGFYSWRLLLLVFHGKPRANASVMEHAHESPLSMSIPLIVLAVGAVMSGMVGSNVLGMLKGDQSFWNNALVVNAELTENMHHLPSVIKFMPTIASLAGIILACLLYVVLPNIPKFISDKLKVIYNLLLNKYYFDEIYEKSFVTPIKSLGVWMWCVLDVILIDNGGPNGMAKTARKVGLLVNRLQSGLIYDYVFFMLLGLTSFITYYILMLR